MSEIDLSQRPEIEPLTEAELNDIVNRTSEIPEVRRLVEEVRRLQDRSGILIAEERAACARVARSAVGNHELSYLRSSLATAHNAMPEHWHERVKTDGRTLAEVAMQEQRDACADAIMTRVEIQG